MMQISDLPAPDRMASPLWVVGIAGSGRRTAVREWVKSWADPASPSLDLADYRLVASEDPPEGAAGVKQFFRWAQLQAPSPRAGLLNLDGCSAMIQNTLLKNFEEPGENTQLIAFSSYPMSVISTLRSRMIRVHHMPPSDLRLMEAAGALGWDPPPLWVSAARGSFTMLEWMHQNQPAMQAIERKSDSEIAAAFLGIEDQRDLLTAFQLLANMHPSSAQATADAVRMLRSGLKPDLAIAAAVSALAA